MMAMRYPERCRSATVVGCGSGSVNHQEFMASSEEHARGLQARGVEYLQEYVAGQPSRRPYQSKDPRAYEKFRRQLVDELRRLRVPTLLIVGDQDEPCVEANLFMRRQCASAGLVVLPRTGHTVLLEEPDLFNDLVLRFLNSVEANRWLPGGGQTAT